MTIHPAAGKGRDDAGVPMTWRTRKLKVSLIVRLPAQSNVMCVGKFKNASVAKMPSPL
jgi:hypothetical protein